MDRFQAEKEISRIRADLDKALEENDAEAEVHRNTVLSSYVICFHEMNNIKALSALVSHPNLPT